MPSHPIQSHPIPSHPIQIQSNPAQSNPTQPNPNPIQCRRSAADRPRGVRTGVSIRIGSILRPLFLAEPFPKCANVFFDRNLVRGPDLRPNLRPIWTQFSVPASLADRPEASPAGGAAPRGPRSELGRAGCSGLADPVQPLVHLNDPSPLAPIPSKTV